MKEAIVKGLGFQSEDFKISGFDLRDALVGHSAVYEFDVEIDKKVMPFKLLEDVNKWEYVDLPIFRVEESIGKEKGLVKKPKLDGGLPVLAPFQLAGPMELWIQDAKDMRISLPVISFLLLDFFSFQFSWLFLFSRKFYWMVYNLFVLC